MGWLSVVKTWLGQSPEPAAPAKARGDVLAPSARAAKVPAPVAEPAPPPAPSLTWLLRREEVLDRAGRLVGHRFSAPGAGDAQDYFTALRQARVGAMAQRRMTLIVLQPEQWDLVDWASEVGPQTVFQLSWPAAPDEASRITAIARRIRAARAGLALVIEGDAQVPVTALGLATHVVTRLNPDAPQRQTEQRWESWRRAQPALQIIVQQVDTWRERHLAMAMGAALALGDFLATVDEDAGAPRLNERRLVLMDMLQVLRQDGDAQALADVAKRDPGVAVQVLSMANAPVYGLQQTITGLEQAMVVLGRDTLYRWLTIALFKAGEEGVRDGALLEVALARARFLEGVALQGGARAQADELFLVGLLSFVDSLLGQPLPEVLGDMSLPDAVSQVLLHNEGPYGVHLLLALAVERGQAQRAQPLAARLGLDGATLERLRAAALQWAEDAAR